MNSHATNGWLYSDLAGDSEIADLVSLFVSELPQRVAELETAFAADRREDLSRLAHQMKGAAGGYGFAPLGSLAGALERALVEKRPREEIAARLGEFVDSCRRARVGRPENVDEKRA